MMNLSFEKAKSSDVLQLKKLWADCFFEKMQAVDLFFDCNEYNFSMYCAKDNQKIVAALYLLPTSINEKKAHYLCGASTMSEYRNHGIMGRLIEYALNDARKSGDVYSVLFPADANLYSFYGKFGYVPKCTAKRITLTREQLQTDNDINLSVDNKIDFEHLQKNCLKNNFLLWNNKFVDFAIKYYGFYGVKAVRSKNCFALIDEYDDCADVIYSIYNDFEELKLLLLKNFTAKKFIFTGKSDNPIFEKSSTEECGMVKLLDENTEIPQDIYIGITLN